VCPYTIAAKSLYDGGDKEFTVTQPSTCSIMIASKSVRYTLTLATAVSTNDVRVQISKSKGMIAVFIPRRCYAINQWPYPRIIFHDTISPLMKLPTTARTISSKDRKNSSETTMLYSLIGSIMSQPERLQRNSADHLPMLAFKDTFHSLLLRFEQAMIAGSQEAKQTGNGHIVGIALTNANGVGHPDGRIIIWIDGIRWLPESQIAVMDTAYVILTETSVDDVASWALERTNTRLSQTAVNQTELDFIINIYLPMCANRTLSHSSFDSRPSSSSLSPSSFASSVPPGLLACVGGPRVAKYFTRAALFPLFPPQGTDALGVSTKDVKGRNRGLDMEKIISVTHIMHFG
jgi:hypothetical protein